MTAEERAQSEAWARRRTSAQALALRSRIVLAAAEGPNSAIHIDVKSSWLNLVESWVAG